MSALMLSRAPFALFLDRVGAPLFFFLLALAFFVVAWRYAVTVHAPETALIMLCAMCGVVLIGVAYTYVRYAPVMTAVDISETGAVTVKTTRGVTTVPAGSAYGATLAGNGVSGYLGRTVALKYRNHDGQDAWLGIGSGYVDAEGTRLTNTELIDRINAAIGGETMVIAQTQRSFDSLVIRVALGLLGFLVVVVGIIATVRIASEK